MASKRLLLATRNAEVTAARHREDAAFVELLGSAANLAALERFGTSPVPDAGPGRLEMVATRGPGRMTGRPRFGPYRPVRVVAGACSSIG